MKMIVYIAGKISGDPHYKQKFAAAEERVREILGKEVVVLNPAVLPEGMEQADYMRICLPMLDTASMIALIPDYKDSNGAGIELKLSDYTDKAKLYL